MKCFKCNGKGEIKTSFEPHYSNKLNYNYMSRPTISTCETCKGKGTINRLLFAIKIILGKV